MPFDGRNLDADLASNLGRIDAVIAKLDDPAKWCKGVLYVADRSHCILGALQAVPGARGLTQPILEAAREITGRRFFDITTFNDRRATSHADVMAVLRRARENLIKRPAFVRSRDTNVSRLARRLFSPATRL